jgi:hypothetical protein
MSIVVSAANTGLTATTNLSNPQSCTKLIWVKFAGTPTSYNTILASHNSSYNQFNLLVAGLGSGQLYISTAPSTFNSFGSQPTWADWTCFAMTSTTAGAGSLIGYWQDNAGGGFVSESITGTSFTITNDDIANQYANQAMTMAFYMEWNTVLTAAQLQTQFLSSTPIVALGNLSRYLPLTNAATAGNDSSGNGFNMTVNGTLTNGASLPTFPPVAPTGAGPVPRTIFVLP